MASSSSRSGIISQTLLIAGGYFALGWVAQLLATGPSLISPAWPASGFALSATLLRKWRALPGIGLGAAAVNYWFFYHNATPQLAIGGAIVSIFGEVAEAWLCTILLNRFLGPLDPFSSFRNTMKFLSLVAVGCVPSFLLGATVLNLSGQATGMDRLSNYMIWWGGDIIGILYLTPLLTLILQETDSIARGRHPDGPIRTFWKVFEPVLTLRPVPYAQTWRYEPAAFFVALSVASLVILSIGSGPHLTPVLLLGLLWACFRLGFAYSQCAAILVASVALFTTARKTGPFIHENINVSIIELHIFLLVAAYTTLSISVSVRRRYDQGVRYFDNALVGIMVTQPDGQIVRVNPTLASMLGYGSTTELRKWVVNTSHDRFYARPGQREELVKEVRESGNGIVQRDKLELKREDGDKTWASYSAREVRDRKGNAIEYISFFTDIRRQMAFFDAAPLGISFSRMDHDRFIEVNAELASILGYEGPEQMCQEVREISHDFYYDPKDREALKRALERSGQAHIQYWAKRRGGQEHRYVEENARLIRGPKNDDQILSFVRDVTDHVRSQQMTELATAINRAIIENDGVAGMLSACAEQINHFFEARATEIWLPRVNAGVRLAAVFPPGDESPAQPSLEDFLDKIAETDLRVRIGAARGKTADISCLLRMTDGDQVLGLVLIVGSSKPDKDVLRNAKSLVNPIAVALRKWLAQERLRQSERESKLIANLAPNGIFLADHRGEQRWVNSELRKMHGVTEDEAYTREWSKNMVSPKAREEVERRWKGYVKSGSRDPYVEENEFYIGGEIQVIRTVVRPLLAGSSILSYIGTTTDVTTEVAERKELQFQLKKIGHDMKHSLTAISNVCRRLEKRLDGDPRTVSDIWLIVEHKEHLKQLLEHALLAARHQAERDAAKESSLDGRWENESFSLQDTLAAWLQVPVVEERDDRHLRCQVCAAIPRRVRGPLRRLKTVLQNLSSNATRHSRKAVTIRALPVTKDAEGVVVEFSVEDDGDGLTRERARSIVDGQDQGVPGTGQLGERLGLMLTRSDLRDVGSSLEMIDRGGPRIRGFRFRMNLTPPSPQSLPSIEPNARAVVIGREGKDREEIESILEDLGLDYHLFGELSELEKYLAADDRVEQIPLVLFAGSCEDHEVDKACQICAARGVAAGARFARIAEPGAEAMEIVERSSCPIIPLIRPLWASELHELLAAPIPDVASPAAPIAGISGPVLLVEDRVDSQIELASNLLRWQATPLVVVSDGEKAVELAGAVEFATILMDIHLGTSALDGYQASHQIRAAQKARASGKQPVILSISVTDLDAEAIGRCRAAEISGMIGKEFDLADLSDLRKKCSADPLSFHGGLPHSRHPYQSAATSGSEPVDLARFEEKYGLASDATALELAQEIGRWVFALSCAVQAGDSDLTKTCLHALEGVGRRRFCGILERAADLHFEGLRGGQLAVGRVPVEELERLGESCVQWVLSHSRTTD